MEPLRQGRVVFGDEDRPGFWDSPAAQKDAQSFVFVSAGDNVDGSDMSKFEQKMDLFRRSSSLFTLEEWESVAGCEAAIDRIDAQTDARKQRDSPPAVEMEVTGELIAHHHQEESIVSTRKHETRIGSGQPAFSSLSDYESKLETSDDWTDIVSSEGKSALGEMFPSDDFEILKRSCHIMSQLEMKGVHYEPLDKTYSLEVVDEVEAKGDCMFLAVAKLMQTSEDRGEGPEAVGPGVHADSSQLRQTAADRFFLQYLASSDTDKVKIDETVKHFYFPDITKGWNIHRTQSRKFIAEIKNRWKINHKIKELMTAEMSWVDAAEVVYSDEYFAKSITNTEVYNDYIRIGGFQGEGGHRRAFDCSPIPF